jgi:hypothetical protein
MDQASMPLLDRGQMRKRWRYVALFAEELMLCAARAEIGPLTHSFWVLCDRERRQQWAHTALRPGSREVAFEGPRLEIDGPGLRASLELGDAAPIEVTCPSGRSWAWTRKRAGMPVTGTVAMPGRRLLEIAGRGVDDESAGHHQRHTGWRWSAGVGTSIEGRNLAWNLVEGINDPPQGSERAIWVDGEPTEPPPVRFRGLEAVERGGDSLDFTSESDHARDDNYLLVRSRYRHRFGSFAGTLGGLTLAEGLGVMEEHDALW